MKNGIVSKGSEYESMATMDAMGKAAKLIVNPTSKEEIKKRLEQDIEMQQEVTDYNMDLCNAHIDKRFTGKKFVGNFVIVKLEKINWLVPSDINPELHTINPLYWLNVVTPDKPRGQLVMNPLPYNYQGVIVAVGDEVISYREKNKLSPIIPGDMAELTWFDMKEFRYYPNKQTVDQITLDAPYAKNFEGFVKVPVQFIETIVSSAEFENVYGNKEDLYKVTVTDVTLEDYEVNTNANEVFE